MAVRHWLRKKIILNQPKTELYEHNEEKPQRQTNACVHPHSHRHWKKWHIIFSVLQILATCNLMKLMEMVLLSSTGLGYIWPKCHSVWHDWHSTWRVSVSAMVAFTLGPRRRSRGKRKKPMDICDSLHTSWLYFSPSLSEICYSFRLFLYSHTICLLCSLSSCLPVHVCFCDVSPQNTCGFCVSQCQLSRCCQTIWRVQMKQQKVVYTEV